MGRHTKKGGYILMEEKMPTYLVPDLSNFQLKPYVSHTAPEKPPTSATGAAASVACAGNFTTFLPYLPFPSVPPLFLPTAQALCLPHCA
ncbi:unnamed protein product [Closterium sp. NIES-65]|nr:unnamed protein product [Closterium sp. NIES-65]